MSGRSADHERLFIRTKLISVIAVLKDQASERREDPRIVTEAQDTERTMPTSARSK